MKYLIQNFVLNLRQIGLIATLSKTKAYLLKTDSRQPLHKQNASIIAIQDAVPDNTCKTSAKWNHSDAVYAIEGFKVYWELLDEVRHYQEAKMTEGRDMLEYLWSFFPKGKEAINLKGLVIGCNYGEEAPPIAMARTGAFKKLLVVDIAEGLLRRQAEITRKMALNDIIEYRRMNLDVDSLQEQGSCDLVFSLGTIHHIRRLEGLFAEISRALSADGIFCMREYIGPSYLQYTAKQVQIVDRILNALPHHMKTERSGAIKTKAWKPTIDEIMADDPSEAVRSQDIMQIASRSLDILVSKMTGGSILDPLLHGIAGNFDGGESEKALLRTFIAMEETLVDEGVLSSDFVFVVARKKAS